MHRNNAHHPVLFAWLTLVAMLLLLKFFRAFKTSRVFIQLLITSFWSIRHFFVVLIVVLLAFTQAFFVGTSDHESESIITKWDDWRVIARAQFLGTVQDPEAEWFEKENVWAFYWLRTIIVLVVLMTLLIAVVLSNYEQVARTMEQQQYAQMCEIIIEQETFMIWNKNKNNQDVNLVFAERSDETQVELL